MSLSLAIKDISRTLGQLQWLKTLAENQEPGTADYTIAIGMGQSETMHHYGARKVKQRLVLTLIVKRKQPQGVISTYLDTLTETLIADRRRTGNAQTTIVGPWLLQADQGREGAVFTSEIEVHYYAS